MTAPLRARVSSAFALSLTFAATLLTACGHGNFLQSPVAQPGNVIKLEGFVHGGQQPITGATIQLYAAGTTGDSSAATPLIAAAPLTNSAGAFSITGLYTCPSITAEVYLVATGGNPGLAPGTNNTSSVMMSALGPCGNLTSATHIIINEATTVGSIYPITAFMNSYLTVGSSSGDFNTLAADFMQINQFIDTDGGQSPGPALPGGFTAPIANLYTLANSVSGCVNSTGATTSGTACGNLFLYATPPGGTAPTNTADAVLDIANNPTNNVNNIFLLSTASPAFQPVLGSAPADWSLKILPNIALTTPSNLVGVGSTTLGTIALGQAAPAGGLVISFVSNNTSAVTVVNPVNIAAGSSTGSFSYTGVAAGTATITATATGYYAGTTTLSATSALISLGTIPVVAPGQSVDLPLSLGVPAPTGGVTVNFTSTASGVATVTGSSFIPAGLKIPASNPQVTGVTVGTASINATATGYAPGSRSVSVSVTASLPTPFTVPLSGPTNETLTISAPAPAGGIAFNLTVDNAAIFSVPSTVTVPQGNTTVNIPITGLTGGTTNLRADSPFITEAVSAVTVNGTINLQSATLTTGKQLQVGTYFYFAAVPPSAVTATITSANPAVAVPSANPTVQGGATATVPGIVGTGTNTFYVQGVSIGTTTFTISAPGYTNTNITVTVDPAGFVIYTPGNFSTTTLSADSSVTIFPAILNPGGSTVLAYGAVTPAATVNVAVGSSDSTVGTITNSPVSFGANVSSLTATFHPVGAGSANLTLTTPAGFSTPSTAQQITATVTGPPINVRSTTETTGKGLEITTYANLSQTPLVPTNVTITSSNPAILAVSTSDTVAGGATATVSNVVTTNPFYYYLQGIATGTASVTISASPYVSATVTVTVDPSGFIIYTPGNFTTTTFSSTSSLTVFPAILNPGTLTVVGYGSVTPQAAPVGVPFTSATTTVGTVSPAPIVFAGASSSQTSAFQPVAAGTSVLALGTPAGFFTPATSQQVTATVTAPPINIQTSILATGKLLQMQTYANLSQAPPTPVTVTVTSDTPSVATVSTSASIAGAASTTFPNTVTANPLYYYVQGQTIGTANLTVSAPGYQSATVAVTVDPAGFIIYTPGNFSTTTFSSPTSITVFPAILNPATLGVINNATLNPGIATINVPVTSSASQVGTVSTPLSFAGGAGSGISTFTPVAAGTTNIAIGTPAGFSTPTPSSSQQLTATVTAPPINVRSSSEVAGQNLEINPYVMLGQTPPSAVTMTATVADPSIATISTSATVAGTGVLTFSSVANANPLYYYIQGHNLGTTSMTFSAAGYANAVVNITVDPSGFIIYSPSAINTTTFSSPPSVTIFPAILNPGSLTVLAYAQVNPGAGTPQVTVASSNTATGTVNSPVTFAAGSTAGTFNFTPGNAGTSTITITQPAGYSVSTTSNTQQIPATVTAPLINVQSTAVNTGANLQINTYATLAQSPPAPVTVNMVSSNPSVAVISTSLTVAGTASLNFTGVSSTNPLYYYVQGLATGSSTITISAPGYVTSTVNVSVTPAGFIIYTGNFNTTTFSSPTNVTVSPAILNSGVLTVASYAALNPGASVAVPITSSTPGVGTVTSPLNLAGGQSSGTFAFQPVAAGSTTLSLGTPVGFTTPSQSSTQQITATVTAPPISYQTATVTTGSNLEVSTYASLYTNPPAAVNVTITSADPTIAKVTTNAGTVGSVSVVFSGVKDTGTLQYFVQGLNLGSTTLTISAPGYATTTINVVVDPSGFIIYTPADFSTKAGGPATTVTVLPAIFNPGVLTVYGYAATSPAIGSVSVPMGSTSPQIGTISPTSLVFTPGSSSVNTSFTPLLAGSTNVIIVSQPTGFTTPSQPVTQQIVVTVN